MVIRYLPPSKAKADGGVVVGKETGMKGGGGEVEEGAVEMIENKQTSKQENQNTLLGHV